MKLSLFTKKTLLTLWRSPQLMGLYLFFPSVMVLIYYSAFGQNSGMANYLTVLIENKDEGFLGAELVTAIRSAEFDGLPAFTVLEGYSAQTAEIFLNEGKAALVVYIPPQFSELIQQSRIEPIQLSVMGDPLSDTFAFSYSFLDDIIRQFQDEINYWEKELPVSLEFLPNTGTLNDFQVGLPGLVIFGIMFGVISNALLLTNERSDGTLQRIRLSKARAFHLLGGVTLANLILSLLQMGITFGVAAAVGFVPVGSPLLAIGIGALTGLSAAGAGFLAACFAKNEGEATAISTAIMVPLVFLSGSIFPLPVVSWFRLFGQTIQPYDLMPTTHAARAMSQVVLYGAGIPEIGYELLSLTFLSILILAAGIFLYQHRVLSHLPRS